ncbi:MAG: inorganic phosphate transporter [Nitrospirae bacterium]|nr:inorganic phosphate transporter [Nitrospirota bacterium]MBI3351071.1 inorganic phosphate transporter [Nitrospirota bacterium]
MEPVYLLVVVIILALIFDFINGFHDSANAIATVISTRVMTPKMGISMAAIMNLIGAFAGTEVAKTVGSGLVAVEAVTQVTIISALIAAIIWDLITWYFGLPTSSSHALLAALVGAGIATGGFKVLIWGGLKKILIALLLSPLFGFAIGWLVMVGLYWLFQKSTPSTVTSISQKLQILSASYMAFSHGSNDSQKSMGIITAALVSFYSWKEFRVPVWVIILCAIAMAVGTAFGGWRIIRTLGLKLTALKPVHGFAAEMSAASVIEMASHIGVPISTTHTISASIMGVGATRRLSAVKWGIGINIVWAWILTLPACAVMAWFVCKMLKLIV